jgi:hypothetical protein
MSRTPKVTENVYKAIKAVGDRLSVKEVSEIFGISMATANRVRVSDSYETYRKETTEACKAIGSKPVLDQNYIEPRHGQVTFYGDALELSKLTSIADILGIEEFEWTLTP